MPSTKALTPSAVSNEPRIYTGSQLTGEGARRAKEEAIDQATQAHTTRGEDPAEGGPGGEQDHTNGTGDDNRGDKGVIGFWKDCRTTIFDVRITDVTAKSYRDGSNNQNLQKGENLNTRKAPQGQPKLHPPVVFSAGSMRKETQVAVRRLAVLSPQQEMGHIICSDMRICAGAGLS